MKFTGRALQRVKAANRKTGGKGFTQILETGFMKEQHGCSRTRKTEHEGGTNGAGKNK